MIVRALRDEAERRENGGGIRPDRDAARVNYAMLPTAARRAFTLFEVAIALGIVALAMVSVLLTFPAGLKAQQMARFRLLAATKAEEMVEAFNAANNSNTGIDTEAPNPWDVPVSYRSQSFDLEQRLSSHRFGIAPVPTQIARRLDSDSDEIASLLDEGGYIYFSQPMATTSIDEGNLPLAPPNEAQKLVFGVVGYAQNNCVHMLAAKNWPYYVPYPSPPLHGLHHFDSVPAGMTKFKWAPDLNNWTPNWRAESACPEEATDPDIAKVFYWLEGDVGYGFLPFAYFIETATPTTTTNPPTRMPGAALQNRDSAVRYVQAAMWYCFQKVPDPNFFAPSSIPSPVPDFIPGTLDDDKWKQVEAMRFLSHAATCLTSWFDFDDTSRPEDLQRGVLIKHVDLGGTPGAPDVLVTDALIRYYHERSMNLVMKYAASLPYDWGAPRPMQRPIMMDHPLLEYDLFSPPAQGPITAAPGVKAAQWKAVPAQRIANAGASYSYPGKPLPKNAAEDAAYWGNTDHFTLTAPFAAAERCRQIVFWSVDWMSFEDAETAPSAPLDASKYAFAAPWTGKSFDDLMSGGAGIDWTDSCLFAYRNPEKVMSFKNSVAGLAAGTPVQSNMVLNDGGWPGPADQGRMTPSRPGAGPAALVFNGRYGADRNFNKKLDIGPLPASARLRAIEVARFNYYDPRVSLTIR